MLKVRQVKEAPRGILYLEDGRFFEGLAFGGLQDVVGEVVFNTSMTGYQEIVTDPSYAGQIIVMTHPEIGNYGANKTDQESRKPFAEGLIVREISPIFSNWRAEQGLGDYLADHQIAGLADVDTRALVRHIRHCGAMRGILSSTDFDRQSLQQKVLDHPSMAGSDYVRTVTTPEAYQWSEGVGKLRVVALDFGVKRNILKCLAMRGCAVTVLPAQTKAQEILSLDPDGIFLSNGPGDPAPLDYIVTEIQALIGERPIFGICLGHQLLARAFGGRTFKMKFGHRGGNQPVMNQSLKRVEITSQNHGFAVDPDSLDSSKIDLTHFSLNDQTLEGFRHRQLPVLSVQYHPEASPGPHDSHYLFDEFVSMMKSRA